MAGLTPTSMRTLVVNAGSSSLKLHVHGADSEEARVHVDDWDGRDVGPIAELVDRAGPVDAVGHRVVHGGTEPRAAVAIDDAVLQQLQSLIPLAPLHQEAALRGIAAATQAVGAEVFQVACFDTAYHATLSPAAATYALPAAWRERWPLRRFGFHGLSHAYAARRAAELVPGARGGPPLRVVSAHLGAGASLCASLGERSVDTTMGFTPLEGLVMATRAGSVDPGLVLWLVTEAGLDAGEVQDQLEHRSGLVGLAGTDDMRQIVERVAAGDAAARLAFDVYTHVLRRELAAMVAALGGVDVVVFTGGVGERSAEVRAAATEGLGYLGLAVDPARNRGSETGDRLISPPHSPVAAVVVEAREDVEIVRLTRNCVRCGI